MLSLCYSYMFCLVPTWSWSLPGRFLINIWSIPGTFVVSTWSLPGLAWFLYGSYVFPTCFYMVYVVHTWSLPSPGPFLGPMWSLPDLAGPKMVPMYSLWAPNEVLMWSHMVPTWSGWSLRSPYPVLVCLPPAWSYLVPPWSIYSTYMVPTWL